MYRKWTCETKKKNKGTHVIQKKIFNLRKKKKKTDQDIWCFSIKYIKANYVNRLQRI